MRRMIMLEMLASPLLLRAAAALPAELETWRGRLTYPGCTTNVPLDIAICKAMHCGAVTCTTPPCAHANWTFQNCDGGHCGQGSGGGPITVGGPGKAANNWTAQGGWGPSAGPGSHGGAFYSLTATLSADRTKLTGGEVYRGGPGATWVSDGTWHATKGAAADTNFTCVPPAPLPWAQCESLPKSWVPPNATNTTRPLIWPLPTLYRRGGASLHVTPGAGFFQLRGGSSTSSSGFSSSSRLLTSAFERYTALTFPHPVASAATTNSDPATISSLTVNVSLLAENFPQLGDNESYALSIRLSGDAVLTAQTVWGALRGLETFSQLVRFDFGTETYILHDAPWQIEDSPRFPHRGLMVDTARHWQPVASLKAIIDSLAYAKLNVPSPEHEYVDEKYGLTEIYLHF
eukprot:COSAG01_NODE_3717_length_5767_cov_157.763585_5_plen_403_part_00